MDENELLIYNEKHDKVNVLYIVSSKSWLLSSVWVDLLDLWPFCYWNKKIKILLLNYLFFRLWLIAVF